MDIHLWSWSLAIAGGLCLIGWPLLKTRTSMLVTQLGMALAFAAHYALEGLQTASTLTGLGALHIVVSLVWGANARTRWIGYAIVPAILLACLSTWTGMPSILSTAGTLFVAFGRVQQRPAMLRLMLLAGAPFWLAHDILVESPVAILDLFSICVGSCVLYSERESWARKGGMWILKNRSQTSPR